ncbi:hypothetical protein E1263_42360, partial [Kribbella antibiotica]
MSISDGTVRIDPASTTYREVSRLYEIAQGLRPGSADRWNRELYARSDDKLGGLGLDGTLRIQQRALDDLAGGNPRRQAEALATVLHESEHARSPVDAPEEPNAVRSAESFGLDEAFTEISTRDQFDEFIRRAGHEGLPKPRLEYPGAVQAGEALLDRVTNSADERRQLLQTALDQPVAMRWDAVADHVVRTELADVVPPNPAHQQAARAELVNRMATGEWRVVKDRPPLGKVTGEITTEGVDRAVKDLRDHYQQNPGEPYPAKVPNQAAAVAVQGEQQRAGDLRRFLGGQASAVGAVRSRPSLG